MDNTVICATGNCTFPAFSSLGFCSNCVDHKDYAQKNSDCIYKTALDLNNMTCTYKFPTSFLNNSIDDPATSDNPAMINGSVSVNFWRSWNETDIQGAFPFLALALTDLSSAPERLKVFQTPFDSQDGVIIPSFFGIYAFIKTNPLTGSKNTAFLEAADICTLSFCAREYNVTVINGALYSEVLSTSYSKLVYHEYKSSKYDLPMFSSSYSFKFVNNTQDFDFKTGFLRFQTLYDVQNLETELHYALGKIFSGSTSMNAVLGDGYAERGIQVRSSSTSLFLDGLNASTDIQASMNNIALAMTRHLREKTNLVAYGQNNTTEVFVHVAWIWLMLPVISIVSGTLLLFFAIKNTKRNGLHAWKTSELALLFHGQNIPLYDPAVSYKVSEMETIAARIQVTLNQKGQMDFAF